MTIKLQIGDCIKLLRKLAAASVHTCISSPPYFGLRDYDVKGQIGLESHPDLFIKKIVEVYREVHRVLRDDGTIWVNMGDSYAGGGRNGQSTIIASARRDDAPIPRSALQYAGYKNKDLMGIPWEIARALRQDGWYLRQDIIWAKPNPMPESVEDRCTKSHEYIFLLSKSQRYYFDAQAISEPLSPRSIARIQQNVEQQKGSTRAVGKVNGPMKARIRRPSGWKNSPQYKNQDARYAKSENPHDESYTDWDQISRNKRSVWNVPTIPFKEAHFATFPPDLIKPCILAGAPIDGWVLDPFAGTGTTGLVAEQLGRNSILIELNPAYADMARKRVKKDRGLFTDMRN